MLSLALLGQVTVIVFDLVTGQFGGAAVGVVLFIAGNQARCSLASPKLSCYICMAAIKSITDGWVLLGNLTSPTTLLFFPFEDNLHHDLMSLASLLAPLCDWGGMRVAWDCFLDPSMVLAHQRLPSAGLRGPQSLQVEVPSAPSERLWSQFSYLTQPPPPSSVEPVRNQGWPEPEVPGEEYHSPTAHAGSFLRRWGLSWSDAANEGAGAARSAEDVPPLGRCGQCGNVISTATQGRLGSGQFANQLYCVECWRSW